MFDFCMKWRSFTRNFDVCHTSLTLYMRSVTLCHTMRTCYIEMCMFYPEIFTFYLEILKFIIKFRHSICLKFKSKKLATFYVEVLMYYLAISAFDIKILKFLYRNIYITSFNIDVFDWYFNNCSRNIDVYLEISTFHLKI